MADLPKIMQIMVETQEYMKSQGSRQWQDGYPTAAIMEADMEQGNSYVVQVEGEIAGIVALMEGQEKDYNCIQGSWLTPGHNYLTIHRMAVTRHRKGQGIGSFMAKQAEQLCRQRSIPSIRVDTYEENDVMKKFLQAQGFQFCGRVTARGGILLPVFEKIILH